MMHGYNKLNSVNFLWIIMLSCSSVSSLLQDCGVPSTAPKNSTFDGKEAAILRGSPWNAAIYRTRDYILICSGTLISTRMIISAAHCFYNQGLRTAANKTTNYEIVMGKYTRDHNKTDNKFQKSYEISDLIYTDLGYNPSFGHYGHDIVVIVPKKPVEFNQFVLPACIDWSMASTTEGFQPGEGTLGKLVGWGNRTSDEGSSFLVPAEIPFIGYRSCPVNKVKQVEPDKFCAGAESAPGPRRGDNGAGLMFPDPQHNGSYFLRGVLSTKRADGWNSTIVIFTDISWHLNWLDKVRNRLEKKAL